MFSNRHTINFAVTSKRARNRQAAFVAALAVASAASVALAGTAAAGTATGGCADGHFCVYADARAGSGCDKVIDATSGRVTIPDDHTICSIRNRTDRRWKGVEIRRGAPDRTIIQVGAHTDLTFARLTIDYFEDRL